MPSGEIRYYDEDDRLIEFKRYHSAEERKAIMEKWKDHALSGDYFIIRPSYSSPVSKDRVIPDKPKPPIVRPPAIYSNIKTYDYAKR